MSPAAISCGRSAHRRTRRLACPALASPSVYPRVPGGFERFFRPRPLRRGRGGGLTPPAGRRGASAMEQARWSGRHGASAMELAPCRTEDDVTAGAHADAAAEVAGWPSWTLGERQLADLELLLSGAFAPLTGFMGAADVAAVAEYATLADGTPWPFPVTLEVPEDAIAPDAGHVMLLEPEGTPLAVLDVTGRSLVTAGPGNGERPLIRLAGRLTAHREPEHGPFRRLQRSPAEVRAELGGEPALAFATRGPLNSRQIGQLRHLAGQLKARILLLPLISGPAEVVTRPEALVRVLLAASASLPARTLVVPVPLAPRDGGPGPELAARATVARAYGATHLFADNADGVPPSEAERSGDHPGGGVAADPGTAIPVVSAGAGRTRGPAGRRRGGARMVRSAGRGGGTGSRPSAAQQAGLRALPDRPVGIGQIHHRQGPPRCADRTRQPQGLAARRRPGATAAVRGPDV